MNRYSVVPRYTAGSPAAVDEQTALRVAREERAAYERLMTGLYGEEEKRRAERLGLGGIVYTYSERQRKPQVSVYDVILDEQRNYQRWEEFSRWSHQNREETARI
jgi:hypothetical protein